MKLYGLFSNQIVTIKFFVYIPPRGSKFFNPTIFENLELDLIQFTTEHEIKNVLIAGDLNGKTNVTRDYVIFDQPNDDIDDDFLNELCFEQFFETLGIQKQRIKTEILTH